MSKRERIPTEYNLFVQANFAPVKERLGGAKAVFGDVMRELGALWRATKTGSVRCIKRRSPGSSPKCTKKFSAHCAEKGRKCQQNKHRRSCVE